MVKISKPALITSLAFAGTILTAAIASAAPNCPVNESFFGTVQRVNGNMLTVRTLTNHWADVSIDSGAQVHTNGNALRPGAYVGLYGCVTPNGVFHASEVTLANNPNGYNERISGVVQRVESGRLIVHETNGATGAWYVPDVDEFHIGQSVSAIGMLAGNGSFYPQSVDGRSVAYDTDVTAQPSAGNTVTLSGTVQRVGSHTLLVWEPSSRHSATWIVPNAGRFRTGERVSATGTEDRRGHFYVHEITIL
ncbi:MAG TPA: hypothetical protein VFN37_07295 [Candidatus Baltobacteraceae bacterium]|nr:hypothetical protein [Candidatus Baltobacteraceae bacterium]